MIVCCKNLEEDDRNDKNVERQVLRYQCDSIGSIKREDYYLQVTDHHKTLIYTNA